jgi:asparagine synthase (glutamine-hydrolysing)
MNLNGNNIYTRGYIVSNEELELPSGLSWSISNVGGYLFYTQSKTALTVWSSGEKNVVIIGLASDIDDVSLTTREIASKVCKIYDSSGCSAAIEYIAYLGGRFICFLIERCASMQVIPDCHATYACYYSQYVRPVFCSHINLLAEVEGNEVNENARSIINSEEYVSPGGKYYPALMLPFKQTELIFANNKLTHDFKDKKISSERFYPFPDSHFSISEVEVEKVNSFNKLLGQNLRAIVKNSIFHISLTGGNDSGVTLSAILREKLESQAKAFTYFNALRAKDMSEDVFEASRRAYKAKISHKLVELKPLDITSDFHKEYSSSFRLGARYPSLARAYYEDLPHDILSLVSTCSETGTAFYKDRSDAEISAKCLAAKFTTSKIKDNPHVIKSFEDYIEHTMFTKDKLAGLDFYDVFYWEHRNAKWASLWYPEADLSHFTVVPFNQRTLIELMLSIPLEQRLNKELLKRSMIS